MRQSVLAALLCVFIATAGIAQETQKTAKPKKKHKTEIIPDSVKNKPSYGGFFFGGLNVHSGNFRTLPDCPNCSPGFSGGSGFGFTAGGIVSFPMNYFMKNDYSDNVRFNLFAGYNHDNADFSVKEATFVNLDGKTVPGEFEYRLNTKLSYLFLNPTVEYRVFDKLYVGFGPGFAVNTYARFYQIEQITKPSDRAVFLYEGKNYRNEFSRAIGNTPPVEVSLSTGLSWDMPINRKESLILTPALYYSFALTPVYTESNWHVHNFRLGASLKYREPAPPPPPPSAPALPPEPVLPGYVPSELPLTASLKAVQLDSNSQVMKDFNIRIEDFVSHSLRPLLCYVFFDENSSVLPSRYDRLTSEEAENYTSKKLQNLDIMQTYYKVLNIIGMRLRDNPESTIKIVGTNSGEGDEKGNKSLSEARAVAVRDYFSSVWKISDDRMRILARNLPDEPSNGDEPGGNEENRRVEISSDDWDITKPISSEDTLRQISTAAIRFYPTANAPAGLDSWKIEAVQAGDVLKSFEGKSALPESLDWTIKQDDPSAPKHGGEIFYTLTVKDAMGSAFKTQKSRLPVTPITISRKRQTRMADKEFEYYSLILFDFGKSKLENDHKRVVDFIKGRLRDASTVTISGYTDAIGDEAINKRISLARAKAVAQRLKIDNAVVRGVGEDEPLIYDNTYPEGRFYCRTVRIVIETPVREDEE